MIDMAHPFDRPILATLWFNSWFVRLRFEGSTVLVESDLEARAGTSCSLQEFLGWFMDGQGFPHNLVSREGTTVMYTYLVTVARQSASFTPTPRPKTEDQMDVDPGIAGEAALAHQEDKSAPSPRSDTSESIARENGRDDDSGPGSQSEQARGAGDRQQQPLDSACAGESSASSRIPGSYEIRLLYQKMRRSSIRLYQRRRTRPQSPCQVGGIRRTSRVTTVHHCLLLSQPELGLPFADPGLDALEAWRMSSATLPAEPAAMPPLDASPVDEPLHDDASNVEFEGDDAGEYRALQRSDTLINCLSSEWKVEFCSVEEFDRRLLLYGC
jgi:hypothetical protein